MRPTTGSLVPLLLSLTFVLAGASACACACKGTPKDDSRPATERPTRLEPYERAEALLKGHGRALEDVKLKLVPELMEEAAAKSFYAYLVESPRVLLYVFEYPHQKVALDKHETVVAMLKREGLLHNAKPVVNGPLLLLAGTESPGAPAATTIEVMEKYLQAFAGEE